MVWGEGDPRDEVDQHLIYEELHLQISTLTEKEQIVIRSRFFDGLTLKATGEIFGVCPERVRCVEAKSLRKLRHPLRSTKLYRMLNGLTEKEHDEILRKKEEQQQKDRLKRRKAIQEQRRKCVVYIRDSYLSLYDDVKAVQPPDSIIDLWWDDMIERVDQYVKNPIEKWIGAHRRKHRQWVKWLIIYFSELAGRYEEAVT